ncbi:hypothetical protein BP5796_11929 [Coleophoma crateriformis]|uniref:Uncharacterized protein n=1 Tax=Coleophoma crateriformis TaxID=565419 RepID=A0A3D8QET7_9HELO|nr:hypothetical protein BP5796_11929 [Coleophoma crateriformis]
MADNQDVAVVDQHVRRFSLIIAEEDPNDTLSHALGTYAQLTETEQQQANAEAVDWQRWVELQEASQYEKSDRLQKQAERMTVLWKKFHSSFGLEKIVKPGQGPPKVQDLQDIVRGAEQSWAKKQDSGFGKTKEVVENFLILMNEHSNLFSVIPSGDKYLSLITGVITSVVKVAVNKRNIENFFPTAMEMIFDELKTVHKSQMIANTTHMKVLTSDLYIAVFEFLGETMDWYQRKWHRVKLALNQDSMKKVENKVADIQDVIRRIRLESSQVTEVRVSQLKGSARRTENAVYRLEGQLDQMEHKLDGMKDAFGKIAGLFDIFRVGEQGTKLLVANGQDEQYKKRNEYAKLSWRKDSGIDAVQSASAQSPVAPEDSAFIPTKNAANSNEASQLLSLTQDEVERWSSDLDSFLDDGRDEIISAVNTLSSPTLPREVVQELQKWIRQPKSTFLWIEGPVGAATEKQLSYAVIRLCDTLQNAGMPCISFFPRYRRRVQPEASPKSPSRGTALTAVLYSILAQIIRILPVEFEYNARLDETTFRSLDGSLESSSAALDLIASFLPYVTGILCFVIDGLQLVDEPETRSPLKRLVAILRAESKRKLLKVLFTTGGMSVAMKESIRMIEKVDASRMLQGRPGTMPRGFSNLNSLKMPSSSSELRSKAGSTGRISQDFEEDSGDTR